MPFQNVNELKNFVVSKRYQPWHNVDFSSGFVIIFHFCVVFVVSQALQEQDKWNYAGAGEFMRDGFMQLMVAFDAADVIQLVRQILEEQEVNWRSVLTFLATFLATFDEAPNLVRGLYL